MARVTALIDHANRTAGSTYTLPDDVAQARAKAGLVAIEDAPGTPEAMPITTAPAPAEATDEEDDHA